MSGSKRKPVRPADPRRALGFAHPSESLEWEMEALERRASQREWRQAGITESAQAGSVGGYDSLPPSAQISNPGESRREGGVNTEALPQIRWVHEESGKAC